MKNKSFVEENGLIALNHLELTHTFGGSWWTEFKTGFMEGWNWAKEAAAEIASVITIAKKWR